MMKNKIASIEHRANQRKESIIYQKQKQENDTDEKQEKEIRMKRN